MLSSPDAPSTCGYESPLHCAASSASLIFNLLKYKHNHQLIYCLVLDASVQVEFASVVQHVAALHDGHSVAIAVRDSCFLRILDTQDKEV
eukprot:1160194-Pelagomonas_calceolata.AAC.3